MKLGLQLMYAVLMVALLGVTQACGHVRRGSSSGYVISDTDFFPTEGPIWKSDGFLVRYLSSHSPDPNPVVRLLRFSTSLDTRSAEIELTFWGPRIDSLPDFDRVTMLDSAWKLEGLLAPWETPLAFFARQLLPEALHSRPSDTTQGDDWEQLMGPAALQVGLRFKMDGAAMAAPTAWRYHGEFAAWHSPADSLAIPIETMAGDRCLQLGQGQRLTILEAAALLAFTFQVVLQSELRQRFGAPPATAGPRLGSPFPIFFRKLEIDSNNPNDQGFCKLELRLELQRSGGLDSSWERGR